jgi:hypothetical protein
MKEENIPKEPSGGKAMSEIGSPSFRVELL